MRQTLVLKQHKGKGTPTWSRPHCKGVCVGGAGEHSQMRSPWDRLPAIGSAERPEKGRSLTDNSQNRRKKSLARPHSVGALPAEQQLKGWAQMPPSLQDRHRAENGVGVGWVFPLQGLRMATSTASTAAWSTLGSHRSVTHTEE